MVKGAADAAPLAVNLTEDLPATTADCVASARSSRFAAGEHFGDSELAIGAVRNHALTRLKMKLFAGVAAADVTLLVANTGLEAIPFAGKCV